MLSPPRSPRRNPVSPPPPSESLIKLQKLGLELGPAGSTSSLRLPSYSNSIRTTPSDLDKPLPLEPPELRRRTSSVYSIETTISNIIDLYGGSREDDNSADDVNVHSSQAYRDTVAPLLSRRLSAAEAEWPPPLPSDSDAISLTESPGSLEGLSPVPSVADSRKVPSFAEFSRNLRDRRADVVSPISASSSEYHRQLAHDTLAPPSPQATPVVHPVSLQAHEQLLPEPMSGAITHVIDTGLVPPPLHLDGSDDVFRMPKEEHDPPISRTASLSQQPMAHRNSYDSHSDSSFVMYTGVGEALKASAGEEVRIRQRLTEKDQERIMAYAAEKYPGMKGNQQNSQRRSGSTRLSQRATDLVRAMSVASKRRSRVKGLTSISQPSRRQKQPAVQNTPYQNYGIEAFFAKNKEKNKGVQKAQARHASKPSEDSQGSRRSRVSDFVEDYYSGQKQLVGVFEGARQKLGRSASEKRREKLKASIKLVGPTQITKEKNSMEVGC